MTFDEAAQNAANNARRELRGSAVERLKKVAGNQQRRSDCHEAFMAGHAKGFASGWAAAMSAGPDRVRAAAVDVEAMAREVCAPFNAERAVRA